MDKNQLLLKIYTVKPCYNQLRTDQTCLLYSGIAITRLICELNSYLGLEILFVIECSL